MTQEHIITNIKARLEDLRPSIQLDGGDIEFVSFIDGIVSLRLHGACVSCPISIFTLKFGIEQQLKEHIPEVKEVIAIN